MPDPRFTDRLLAADPPDPAARERYHQQVRAMFDTVLGPRQRSLYLLTAVGLAGAAAAVGFGMRAPAGPWPPAVAADLARIVRVLSVALAVIFAAAALLSGRLWWTGAADQRTSARWAAGIGVCAVGVVGWFLLALSRHLPADPIRDDFRLAGGLLVLVALAGWVRARVAQAEQATAERLLELELRLAELHEAIRDGAGRPAPSSGQAEGVVA